MPIASNDSRCGVQCESDRNRIDNRIPSVNATAWPLAVKSDPATATTSAVVTQPPTHAGRHLMGIAAVRVPRTARAP